MATYEKMKEVRLPWTKFGNEWQCIHGVGHADFEGALRAVKHWKMDKSKTGFHYSSSEFYKEIPLDKIEKILKWFESNINAYSMHGCDGCCGHDDFPGVNKEEYIENLLSNCKRFSYDFIDIVDWLVLISHDRKYINWYKAEKLRKR